MTYKNQKMCDCPRFDRCSAPICPLDAEWRTRVYRKGEPVCFYLLEYDKPGAKARFEGCIEGLIHEVIAKDVDALFRRYAPLQKALERAKRTGSRMKARRTTQTVRVTPGQREAAGKRHPDRIVGNGLRKERAGRRRRNRVYSGEWGR